jgi:hypothetical protein
MDKSFFPRAALSFLQQQDTFARFRLALRRQDQQILDDLFTSAGQHVSAADLADRALPFDAMLLCMLIEQQKVIQRLQSTVDEIRVAVTPAVD